MNLEYVHHGDDERRGEKEHEYVQDIPFRAFEAEEKKNSFGLSLSFMFAGICVNPFHKRPSLPHLLSDFSFPGLICEGRADSRECSCHALVSCTGNTEKPHQAHEKELRGRYLYFFSLSLPFRAPPVYPAGSSQ